MDEMVIHATTVICVRRDGQVAMAGDGQVTVGNTVMKHGAAKVRRLYHDKILSGFAGSAADAFALYSRFEAKLEEYRGNMERAVVELAKDWRMDKYLRQLQAMLIVANAERAYLISGTGDLIQPDDGILAIGSGGSFALSAARALMKHTQLSAAQIAEESMRVAAEVCIYTNDRITVETL
ncbi:MAG TPA: ATP-dependent protease subunit HslV [Thermoanaerobaculia bacterium]|nr:ATP-dependent protease subunit HslV [Thermoanaerobaculia bacterium]